MNRKNAQNLLLRLIFDKECLHIENVKMCFYAKTKCPFVSSRIDAIFFAYASSSESDSKGSRSVCFHFSTFTSTIEKSVIFVLCLILFNVTLIVLSFQRTDETSRLNEMKRFLERVTVGPTQKIVLSSLGPIGRDPGRVTIGQDDLRAERIRHGEEQDERKGGGGDQ